jgi:hypothetical protein
MRLRLGARLGTGMRLGTAGLRMGTAGRLGTAAAGVSPQAALLSLISLSRCSLEHCQSDLFVSAAHPRVQGEGGDKRPMTAVKAAGFQSSKCACACACVRVLQIAQQTAIRHTGTPSDISLLVHAPQRPGGRRSIPRRQAARRCRPSKRPPRTALRRQSRPRSEKPTRCSKRARMPSPWATHRR